MELKIIGKACEAIDKCKMLAEVNKPQLTAAAGTGCFIGAVVFATKETPAAIDAVEKKRVTNPDMTKLEEAAVKIPYYAKTLGLATAGLGLTFLAWKFEAAKVIAMATMCGELANENSSLRTAVHDIVDADTEEKIVSKAEENKNLYGKDADALIPTEHLVVGITISLTGKTIWDTKAKQETKLKKVIEKLKRQGWITIGEVFDICEWGYCDLAEKDYYYSCQIGNEEAAKNAFDYYFEPDEDEYGRLGYTLHVPDYSYTKY